MSVTTYIQGHDASTLASHRSRTASKQADYLLPHINPASQILDVGCGPGTITCDFGAIASEGTVVGVDYSEVVVEQAKAEAQTRNVKNVSFQVATAHQLPFPDDSFDIVHCHAVLVHLPTPIAAIQEMRRVCKPGGFVAAREPDWGTCAMHPLDPRLQRWLECHIKLKELQGAEPNTGRFLAEWALSAGFDQSKVAVTCDVLQYFGKEQVLWWGELYAKRMTTEEAVRTYQSGIASKREVEGFEQAYREWSVKEGAIWALTHMELLAQK